jgi:hypothetical protein
MLGVAVLIAKPGHPAVPHGGFEFPFSARRAIGEAGIEASVPELLEFAVRWGGGCGYGVRQGFSLFERVVRERIRGFD